MGNPPGNGGFFVETIVADEADLGSRIGAMHDRACRGPPNPV